MLDSECYQPSESTSNGSKTKPVSHSQTHLMLRVEESYMCISALPITEEYGNLHRYKGIAGPKQASNTPKKNLATIMPRKLNEVAYFSL